MNLSLTPSDIRQIESKQIGLEIIESQIQNFKKGFPFINIIAPATVENGGIKRLNEMETAKYVKIYEKESQQKRIIKFVPASGAASRMFKDLYAFIEQYGDNPEILNSKDFKSVAEFFEKIDRFAFFDDLKSLCNATKTDIAGDYKRVLENLLRENGMNYGNLPKALLNFHRYENQSRTSAEEHLCEGAMYASSAGKSAIHFTVSPEHQDRFTALISSILPDYEKKYDVKYEISYSEQHPSTDTIAVDLDNNPFREADGSLLFRPGGHGALIKNLNEIDADIIFVKNIDNVAPDRMKNNTVTYKKACAGLLLETQTQIFEFIKKLETRTKEQDIAEIKYFIENVLSIQTDREFESKSLHEKKEYMLRKLNRPLRVCGMVKNEGEPGGGPFFVQARSGSVSLQIVESAEIDMKNPEKQTLVKNATHFNPVDLVLAVADYRGKKFDLNEFVDPETGFISKKSKDGRDLKAQELPGLWNGAMAFWNTIFVEVPIETFNPVKTVNDLLRKEHQQNL